jgi:hypothetical protein
MDPLSTTLPPGDIFAGLASPRLEERDASSHLAILMGTALSQRLLLWDDAPPSNRARRLWTYLGAHLRRAEQYVRQPRNFELRHDGTLASVLGVLAARHGVLVARELPLEAQRPVKLALAETSLLGAIDAAALQAGCRAHQHARGELAVTAGAEPRYPACYLGPLRVRAVELRTIRTSDFVTARTSAHVRLRLDWEWPINPLAPLSVRIDGDERRFETTPANNVVSVGPVAEAVIELEGGPRPIAGAIGGIFDGAFDEVRLAVPGTVELHGLSASAALTPDGVTLALDAPHRSDGLGLSPMVLAIAADGEEGIPHVHRVRTVNTTSERWTLRNRDGFPAVRELRLRICAPAVRAAFPFALALMGDSLPAA